VSASSMGTTFAGSAADLGGADAGDGAGGGEDDGLIVVDLAGAHVEQAGAADRAGRGGGDGCEQKKTDEGWEKFVQATSQEK